MAKAAKAQSGGTAELLSIKVTLRHLTPPIWRRLLMPASMSLGDLHLAIQDAVGWDGEHLYAFMIEDRQYSEPGMLDDAADKDGFSLRTLLKSGPAKFVYTYDFGDNWDHLTEIEKSQPAAGRAYPTCVAGKRRCPPDDCGGAPGYESLIEILADPKHPEYAERMEWVGAAFDPGASSMEEANRRLAMMFGCS